jgi:hypothetical protein
MIKRRGRLGMIASLSGIAVLALGMLASFRQQFVWASLLALVVGFLLAQFGTYNLRRWGRSPRPDEVLAEGMKGFDDRFHFYAWSLPTPYVLLSPQGIYTLTTRDQSGQVSVTGSTWKSKLSLGRLLAIFGQEGLGNPTMDAQAQAAKLGAWIKSKLPDLNVEVQPVVVFIDARVQLEIDAPTVPVLDPKGIKKWLRGGNKGQNLRTTDLRSLETLFDAEAAAR